MFEDPSGGIFNKRLMLQFFMMTQNTNMTVKERADVFDLLHVTTLKFVSARDRMNHFQHGGMSPMSFGVASIIERDSVQTLHRARINPNQLVKDVMTTLMNNLLEFIEYFLGISIAVGAPDYAVQWNASNDPMQARWGMIHGAIVEQMIKAGQLDPNKIRT